MPAAATELISITDRTQLPLAWALSCVVTAVALGIAVGAEHFMNNTQGDKIVVLETTVAKMREDNFQRDLRLQRNQDTVDRIMDALGEIRSDVKALKARAVQ